MHCVCKFTYSPRMDKEHPDAAIVDALGGPTVVGRIFQINSQAVSAWKKSGIPRARRMYLELVHPDAFKPQQKTEERAPS